MTVLAELVLRDTTVRLRDALAGDVPALVQLLTDDPLGSGREGGSDPDGQAPYLRAFAAIRADPAHLLVVADDGAGPVAMMQLSLLPGLARRGALRAQIEAVRVHADHRSQGLGTAMIEWAISESRRRGAALVQLTSDKHRTDAHRFYEHLGFAASHEGLKLLL